MTAPAFVTAAAVREYMTLNVVGSTSQYSDATLGSNIRAASEFLERATGRQWANQAATTKKFTTEGRALLPLPGLRTATTVTLNSAALTADETYWLIPDVQQTGVYVAIQFRAFGYGRGAYSYLGNPEWFDRNLDQPWAAAGGGSLPNDLVIVGDWGYAAGTEPEALLHATKVLAAWYTVRPRSVLGNVAITPEGMAIDYSSLPPEVVAFIAEYRLGAQVVSV